MIKVTHISRLTGKYNTMELPVSALGYRIWSMPKPEYRADPNRVFPHLTSDQIDFLVSGIIPAELATAA